MGFISSDPVVYVSASTEAPRRVLEKILDSVLINSWCDDSSFGSDGIKLVASQFHSRGSIGVRS